MAAPRSPETLAFLDREGLVAFTVEADGNCLIGSILAALDLRIAWLPRQVRERLADALRCLFEELPEAADLLQELLIDSENFKSLDDLLRACRTRGHPLPVWALALLAPFMRVNVKVFTPTEHGPPRTDTWSCPGAVGTIHLLQEQTGVPGLTHFSPLLHLDSQAPPEGAALPLASQDAVVYAALLWVLPALISNAEQQLRAAATAAEKERLERVLLILKERLDRLRASAPQPAHADEDARPAAPAGGGGGSSSSSSSSSSGGCAFLRARPPQKRERPQPPAASPPELIREFEQLRCPLLRLARVQEGGGSAARSSSDLVEPPQLQSALESAGLSVARSRSAKHPSLWTPAAAAGHLKWAGVRGRSDAALAALAAVKAAAPASGKKRGARSRAGQQHPGARFAEWHLADLELKARCATLEKRVRESEAAMEGDAAAAAAAVISEAECRAKLRAATAEAKATDAAFVAARRRLKRRDEKRHKRRRRSAELAAARADLERHRRAMPPLPALPAADPQAWHRVVKGALSAFDSAVDASAAARHSLVAATDAYSRLVRACPFEAHAPRKRGGAACRAAR
ncbi:hypothetical protein Rsub_00585 [Raphidocelis subcapitata]|uniref:OTU domain-containing protein n=1 Tax=Raphidocelis subcapitata TaxID=307507 RepID=A0A2V0NQP7_9CHLO|nr:hypothetical protein Rsub_00585 [Raphidocelis subcapitata]|eukprot:GBF87873.1 hypothetical protein Rsub_00585 [Raphidocelis subcapitata]